MTKPKLLSAALMAATLLATPAMARENHVSSPLLAAFANAGTKPGAHYVGEGDRLSFRRNEGHDLWGHWGTYYGPMVSAP